ncbi:HlyD family secretion protein [Syntrophus gentianae]|uniref:HlyD family secretion protein n=1 Tax=Syntrophus gentianae TaxID=43775 RepID=A0A1H7V532_9BACT|nr:efflux RND transporter periplasmic adaptor subunit [Syntrophus gentianae]SEM03935.1 HlyD family secretion protein [Syntrophus gentianae]
MKEKPDTTDETTDITRTLEIDQTPGRFSNWKKWRIPLLAIVLVTAVAVVFFWKGRDTSGAVRYETQEVKRGNLTVVVTATGTLQPTNSVEVGSELSGTIRTVEVDYNDQVKVGQILAKLDTSKLEATITQYRAALEAEKAKVLQADATVAETRAKLAQYKRVWELSKGKVPSQTEMDAAEAAFARAQANAANCRAAVAQAQATLSASETDLSKSTIRSPINGIVLTRSVEPGQTVAASMTTPVLFKLAEDLAQMELQVNVDEADVGKIREGQEATFTVDAWPDRTFSARVVQARYGSTTTEGVVTYTTVLKVDNSDLSLRPGMTATASITVNSVENAILLPSAALRFTPPVEQEKKSSGGLVSMLLPRPPRSSSTSHEAAADKKQQKVWILKDGQPQAISVTVGATDGVLTEVLKSDLKPGTAVVIDSVKGKK